MKTSIKTRSGVENLVERARDSGMIPNAVPGRTRTEFRDEGEHRFRSEAEQFQPDPGIVFGLSPE
jgi:hypothetical protein